MRTGPRRLLKHAARLLALLVLLPPLYVGAACLLMLWPTGAPPAPGEAPEVEAYVISNGVHTDLVLPTQAAGVDWRIHFPTSHARQQAPTDFVAIGWGDREFYLNTPTWAELTVARALGAMLGRHPSALHVSWLQRAQLPPGASWRLPLSAAQYRRIVDHVRRSLPGGQARPIAGAHLDDNDAFYAATGRYHLLRTCNEWTAEALRTAGVPVGRWAPFDFNVRWHLAPL